MDNTLTQDQKNLAKGGRDVMGQGGVEKLSELTQNVFKSEGIAWTRGNLRAYIAGIDFSLHSDTYEDMQGVKTLEDIKGKVAFTKQRQRTFLNLCGMWAILEDWNKKVEAHMSSVAI